MEKEYNKNLLKRLTTAVALTVPIILIIFVQNFWVFFLTLTLICSFGYYEWIKNKFRHPILWGFNLIFGYFWLWIIVIVGVFSLNILNDMNNLISPSIYFLFLIIIFNTAIFDTFAYIAGSNIGKTPITPNISPNKTWEGLFGGLMANIFYAIIICNFFDLSYWLAPIFIFGGLLAFVGDLIISFHKREKSLKDTGSILPGHGGILDRLDSHLVATPITILITLFAI